MQTGYTAGIQNKEVAFAAPFVHVVGREAAGKEPVPTTKPHLLREKGSAENRTAAQAEKRGRGERGVAGSLQTCGFPGRIPEKSPWKSRPHLSFLGPTGSLM